MKTQSESKSANAFEDLVKSSRMDGARDIKFCLSNNTVSPDEVARQAKNILEAAQKDSVTKYMDY